MKNKLILGLLSILILMPSILAASYEIEINQYGSSVLEKHYILLDEQENLEISLPEKYRSLEVLNNYSLIDGKIVVNDKEIAFSFVNDGAIDIGKNYYLTKKIAPGIDLDELIITLILDEGFVVSKDVYPQTNDISSDGRRIIIQWYFEDLSENDSVPIFVIIESIKGIDYFWIIIILIALGFAGWYFYPKIKAKIEEFKKIAKKPIKKKKLKEELAKHLLENEKKVYDELKKENGLWQKQIQIRTGLNKVKLSRVLKNLEKRGFIRKENYGKTNKIYLKR